MSGRCVTAWVLLGNRRRPRVLQVEIEDVGSWRKHWRVRRPPKIARETQVKAVEGKCMTHPFSHVFCVTGAPQGAYSTAPAAAGRACSNLGSPYHRSVSARRQAESIAGVQLLSWDGGTTQVSRCTAVGCTVITSCGRSFRRRLDAQYRRAEVPPAAARIPCRGAMSSDSERALGRLRRAQIQG